MKSSLKAKLIQHLAAKKGNAGFTLIELLVVIIIIGILSAIALPSFLNQANKARQSEAKTYVGSINRGQQAYFLEKNTFSDTIPKLGIGVADDTTSYAYDVPAGTAFATHVVATAKNEALREYYGVTQLTQVDGEEATTLAVLCESTTAGIGVLDKTTPATYVTEYDGTAKATVNVTCDGAAVDSIQ